LTTCSIGSTVPERAEHAYIVADADDPDNAEPPAVGEQRTRRPCDQFETIVVNSPSSSQSSEKRRKPEAVPNLNRHRRGSRPSYGSYRVCRQARQSPRWNTRTSCEPREQRCVSATPSGVEVRRRRADADGLDVDVQVLPCADHVGSSRPHWWTRSVGSKARRTFVPAGSSRLVSADA
jgi:hypothetical protein